MAEQSPAVIVMEAYGSAHYWAREMIRLGDEVKLIAPHYVKPFVKRQKNDAADGKAIVIASGLSCDDVARARHGSSRTKKTKITLASPGASTDDPSFGRARLTFRLSLNAGSLNAASISAVS